MTVGAVATTAKARKDKEQELLQNDTDVRALVLDAVAKGVPGVNIANSIVDGEVLRTIEGASQVTITVHDMARNIFKSGVLQDDDGDLRAIDFNLDDLWFRLAKVAKQTDDIVITAEDRDVSYLRDKKGPRTLGSRKSVGHPKGLTRAEAVLELIRSVKIHRIPAMIHELHKLQPLAKLTDTQREVRRKQRDSLTDKDLRRAPGFPDNAKVPHVNARQLARMSIALTQAEKDNAPERAVLAMLVAGFGESDWGENTGARGTTFQTTKIPESRIDLQAHYFLVGGHSFKAGGAIQMVREGGPRTVGDIASAVEVSDASGPHYDIYFDKARKVLDEWGGVSGGPGGPQKIESYRKRYAFTVHRDETYWDAIQRYAKDVNWRAFFSSGVFHYISEEDLFKSRARYRIAEGMDGVINIDHEWDRRKKINKATATVHIHRWAIPPGTVIIVDDAGPASGRWLVASVTRNLFSTEATLELKKPAREKKEPRTELVRRQQQSQDPDGTNSPGGPSSLPASGGVAPPLNRILNHSNGWSGPSGHDGVDLICGANAPIYAICDATVIDVRSGGWWGKNPTGDVSKGDGIIQLECQVDTGPFKKGMHFGYGHAEHAIVKVGDQVNAGAHIGHAGFANAWHVHFMANSGATSRGVGDRDPWPYVEYAMRKRNRSKLDQDYPGANP